MSAQEPKAERSGVNATLPEELDPQKQEAVIDELLSRLRTENTRHSEELQQFSYAISHDLREPLRMIASYTQLLSRRYTNQLDDDARDFIGFIVDAVKRAEAMLADLVTYSHQLRPLEGPPKLIDAEVVLDGVLLSLDADIRKSGAQITHDALPKITFDFQRLTQLFRQLIANAIKFHGPEPPRIHIAAQSAGDEVVFSVSDNGTGIEPRYREQIFGIFQRLHGREYPGTGIGLALCKRIVEQQGGRIWVESEAGQGATFKFSLPQ